MDFDFPTVLSNVELTQRDFQVHLVVPRQPRRKSQRVKPVTQVQRITRITLVTFLTHRNDTTEFRENKLKYIFQIYVKFVVHFN